MIGAIQNLVDFMEKYDVIAAHSFSVLQNGNIRVTWRNKRNRICVDFKENGYVSLKLDTKPFSFGISIIKSYFVNISKDLMVNILEEHNLWTMVKV